MTVAAVQTGVQHPQAARSHGSSQQQQGSRGGANGGQPSMLPAAFANVPCTLARSASATSSGRTGSRQPSARAPVAGEPSYLGLYQHLLPPGHSSTFMTTSHIGVF